MQQLIVNPTPQPRGRVEHWIFSLAIAVFPPTYIAYSIKNLLTPGEHQQLNLSYTFD